MSRTYFPDYPWPVPHFRTLEALLLTRVQLCGSRPPPGLRHLWLADCIAPDALADTWQGWRAAAAAGGYEQLPPDQPPVELAWVQVGTWPRYTWCESINSSLLGCASSDVTRGM